MSEDSLHRRFRQLLGESFEFLGEQWVLIEVLADSDCVVLRRAGSPHATPTVQQNAYGLPNRRVEETLTLQISSGSGDGYSDEILMLLEGRRINPSPR